ncbi:potassium channel family protein [Methanogenium organophilum]|uniref:Potassium channel protein n=1 Tax=Methanogenium organophilum TaxID=2199 RepID=A0A9X9S3Y5_METOG|nr:TrkA C-terminal domain-containing protein [Methanogenium organophilum]WAI01514.1 potassium channel protein [Methanogenium organophilum]
MSDLEYQPVSFKDVLIEMKDISELMVDLAYSAILFESREIAQEVITLEERMNQLVYQARIQSILGSRRVEEAEAMSGMLQVSEAAEKISNSASEIATIILKDVKFPAKLRLAMPDAEEVTKRVVVGKESVIDGMTLGEQSLQSSTGMRVIAIRRGVSWIYDPERETRILDGDIVIAKGPESGIMPLYELCGRDVPVTDESPEGSVVTDLDRAVRLIVKMKDTSELAVGLAYTSLLFNNREVADEVVSLGTRMDDMRYELDLWILEAAKRISNVEYLRGLLYMSSFADNITNAAGSIVDVILRDIEIPPLFRKIVRESDEIISRIRVEAGSELAGKSLKEASLSTVTGMVVLAIRHENKWKYRPRKDEKLQSGDIIIAKGRRDGECRLYDLSR